MRFTTVAVLVTCVVACCNAQELATARQLDVVTDVRNGVAIPDYYHSDSLHVIIKLKSGISFNDARRNGLNIVRQLDNNWVVVTGRKSSVKRHAKIIEQTQPVNFLWKLSDNLINADLSLRRDYVIQTSAPDELIRMLRTKNVSASMAAGFVKVLGVHVNHLSSILLDHKVVYVGSESFEPKEESPVLDLYLGPNKINTVHNNYPDLNGSGIVVSLKERFYDAGDIDLRGRHVASSLSSNDTSNHATEMATIVAGAGNSFITGRGVASHAQVTSSSFTNLFPDSPSSFTSLNSFLQNHSYGTVIENFYGALANAYDQHAVQNPTILHVFSSGNSGTSNATSGVYTATPGYANITGNSKMAKNILVVGAADTTGRVVPFSSRGPAYDGRVKPELVAYSSVGTSNAAALVSGVAALLQQAYKTQTSTYPASALLKAIIINSADDAGAPGLDFVTGYGSLNALRAIQNLLAGRYFEGNIALNEIKSFDLNIPADARNLKVTLVWNDPAAQPNAAKALINNLDLQVTSTAGAVFPWVLNSAPNAASLSAAATRGVDNLNNIEQVTIDTPPAGSYTISIKGTSLSTTNQDFFIAYQWEDDDSFAWTFPTADDNFPYNGETGTYFFWKSTKATSTGNLEVSTDNGSTWTTVAAQLDLKKGHYRWRNPVAKNTTARARMKIGTSYFETEEFTISRSFTPSLGFNCADSVLLQWGDVKDALHYEVGVVSGNYTSPYAVMTDTALVIDKDVNRYYSVQPFLSNGRRLLRSPSINIEKFGAGCFVTTFIDESITDDGITLRLELGTRYGVSGVVFEHLAGKEFTNIFTTGNLTSNVIRFLHEEPYQGINRYRARVFFINGEQVVTDTIQNYFLTKTPFIVFPNPVESADDLNVYAGKFEAINHTFELFNASGQWVLSADLRSDREVISTASLPPGLYIFRIRGDRVDLSGKLMVR